VLDALAQAAGPGEADRRVRGSSSSSVAASLSRSGPPASAALASGASSSAIPRFVFAGAARRDACTTARIVSPTPRSPARASSGPTAIALRTMSS
jgi:hypothetical protein